MKSNRSQFYLVLIFVVATALVFFLMALTFKQLNASSTQRDALNKSFDLALKIERIYAEVKEVETQRRNYIITEDAVFKKDFIEGSNEIIKLVPEVERMVLGDSIQWESFKKLKSLVDKKLEFASSTFEPGAIQDPENKLPDLTYGNDLVADIAKVTKEMLDQEKARIEERKAVLGLSEKNMPFYLYVTGIFSLGVLAFTFYRISKDVKNQRKINQELQLSLDTLNLYESVWKYGQWRWDIKKQEFHFSDSMYRILGYKPGDFPDALEYFYKLIHPEDLEYVKSKLEEMRNGNAVDDFVCRVIKEEGTLRHFQVSSREVTMLDGSSLILGITTDITEDVEATLELEGVNWMLRNKIKNLSVASETFDEAEKIGNFGTWQWFIDEDRHVFSDNMYRLFGMERGEIDEDVERFMEFVIKEDMANTRAKYLLMTKGKDVPTFVHRIQRENDKQQRYLSVSSKKINDPKTGNYLLVIVQDITNQFLSTQTIEENNLSLQAKNKELEAFNYVASHDLQEPLRKIETFLSRLSDKDKDHLSENGKMYLERTMNAAGRMRSLIQDLLSFSRTSRSEGEMEKVDLNRVLIDVKEELSSQIEEKNAEIISDNLPEITAVTFQMYQLFLNLISNSLKYASDDRQPIIIISTSFINPKDVNFPSSRAFTKYVMIRFEDNGIGFENEYKEKIFQLFNRLHGKSEYQGNGIGLAICKKIVENHQGQISAEARENEGAIFTVILPVGPN